MNTVAEVLRPEFARSWHECVAIVQEAASLMQPGVGLPGPEDLQLGQDGTLTFGFGSESSDHPVTGLATLLHELLDGVEAPGGLRDLALENSSATPAHTTIDGFSRALAFYERPNRASDLRAIAGRLRASRDHFSPDQEFARLRDRVAHGTESDAPEKRKDDTPKATPRLTRLQRQVIAAGVIAGLVVGFGTLQYRNNGGFNMAGLFASVDDGLTEVVAAGLNSIGMSIPESSPPRANEPVEKPAPARPQASPVASSGGPRSSRLPGSGLRPAGPRRDAVNSLNSVVPADSGGSPVAPSSTTGVRDLPRVAMLPPPPPVPEAFEPSARIYSPDDDEVAPPVLVRPQMPREPRPGEDTGWFDLLIDETGSVEQVKLISPVRRYQERMLMAAAKAWRFKPATLDGQPVKYRVRVPIILPGMP